MWDEIYAQNPLEIIMFRHGGLAIQGGLIAGIAFSLWYFKKHNIDYMVAGDAIMPGVLIAQAFGRWGNFFNQEAYGSAVSLDYYYNHFTYQILSLMVCILMVYIISQRFCMNQ